MYEVLAQIQQIEMERRTKKDKNLTASICHVFLFCPYAERLTLPEHHVNYLYISDRTSP